MLTNICLVHYACQLKVLCISRIIVGMKSNGKKKTLSIQSMENVNCLLTAKEVKHVGNAVQKPKDKVVLHMLLIIEIQLPSRIHTYLHCCSPCFWELITLSN